MKGIKRVFGLFLVVALNLLNPMVVQAEETEELEYWEILGETETSAYALNMRSLANGTVELKDSNETEWIDRLDLSEVPEIRTLYDTLVEASDNDGVNDYFIEDTYFAQDTTIPVVTVTGTFEEGETLSSVMNAVYSQYKPFISAAFCAFDRDHPEVFWLSGQWNSGVSASGGSMNYSVRIYFSVRKTSSNGSVFDIRHEDYQSEEIIKEAMTARDTYVNNFISETTGMEDYEMIAHFNEKLIKTNQYNTSSDLNNISHDCRECVSALAGSIGTTGPVCEGYARAFKVLCDKAGITCVLVDGKATNSAGNTEGHMWNYVQLDGAWYAVDVTWNDPVPADGGSGAVSGYETDKWLLVGSDTVINGYKFIVSHPVENSVSSSVIAFTNGPVLNFEAYRICPSKKYTDVKADKWYHPYVDYVVAAGLMNGTANDKFSPDKTTSRAMIVTVLHRMAGLPQTETAAEFTDVESGSWYEASVAWAAENGIVKGITETTFKPNDDITREQLAAMLYRYAAWANEHGESNVNLKAKGDLSKYYDADRISNYAIVNMEWAVGVELFKGDDKNMLNPKETATRAEVATTFQRLCEAVLQIAE